MTSDKSIRNRIVLGLQTKLITDVLGISSKGLLVLVLTRYLLSPEQFGLLFFAISVLSVAMLFASLGFAKSTARYVSDYMVADKTQVRYIIRIGLGYNLTMICVVSAALFGFHKQIATLVDKPALTPFLLLGPLFVGFRSLQLFLRLVFQGFNEVWWTSLVSTVSSIGRLFFTVGFVLIGYGTIGAFMGYITATAIASIVGFCVLYLRFYLSLPKSDNIETDLSQRILRYNFPLTATRGANILNGRVDQILVGVLLTPAAVGFYTLGKQISEFVIVPARTLGFVVSPAYGSLKADDKNKDAASIYQTSLKNILLIYIPAATGLMLIAEPAVRLIFGTDYLRAVPVVQVLSLFVIVMAIDNITNDGLDYLGRARERAIAKTAGAIANLVLNVLLIPAMGIIGAAIATVITTSATVGVNIFLINRELSFSIRELIRTVAYVFAITVVMAVTVSLFLPFISDIPTLLGAITAGGIVWVVLAILVGLIDVNDIRTALGNVARSSR